MAGMAPRCELFAAQMVMEDEAAHKLRHSKRNGELRIIVEQQTAIFQYPSGGKSKLFQRKFRQPRKCIIGRRVLRMYSDNGTRTFMCRLASVDTVSLCIRVLESIGVEVIHFNALLYGETPQQNPPPLPPALAQVHELLAEEENHDAIHAAFLDYCQSAQADEDTDCILTTLFGL